MTRYEDHGTHTEADAGRFERAHAEDDEDRFTAADLTPADFTPARTPVQLAEAWEASRARERTDRERA